SLSTAVTATEILAETSSSRSCTLAMLALPLGPASANRDFDLVLHHGQDLLAQLGTLGVTVGRDSMLGRSLEHLALGTRDRQRAVVLAGKVPAVGNLAAHRPPFAEAHRLRLDPVIVRLATVRCGRPTLRRAGRPYSRAACAGLLLAPRTRPSGGRTRPRCGGGLLRTRRA